MAFTEKQKQKITKAGEAFLDRRRPPQEVRQQLDLAYRIEGQSVYIFEIRPRWDKPSEIMKIDVAKTTFVKTKNKWKVYWMRGDLKWYAYPPKALVNTINHFFNLVDKDSHACFFG